ncbi:MAG: NAD(P)/FAD-dependent oxidoreductase [Candidatus Tectomicrobia bacterium]|nr:NAD(P)/FAD-dependent oxidoreductase [Candidatus Tectomicrobia bacterium]
MAEEFDLVVIGGGHNGLACAAYLQKAGMSTCVLERRHNIGGGCATEEVTLPGFKHNLHSVMHIGGPMYRTLELDKYGAKYVRPDPNYAFVTRDGRAILSYLDVDATCETIAQFSKKDAKTYKSLNEKFQHLRQVVNAYWHSEPLPLSKLYALLEGAPDGKLMIQILNSSVKQVTDAFFENEAVKCWLAIAAMQGSVPYDLAGTGLQIPTMVSAMHGHSNGICIGGSRMLAEALVNVITAAGGAVRKNSHVAKVIVEHGTATGVELENGSQIMARCAIASNTNVKALMLELVGEACLDDEFARRVRAFQADEVSFFTPHFALNEPPLYAAARKNPDVQKALGVAWGVEHSAEILSHHYQLRQGLVPRECVAFSIAPTVHDPSQAPPGKHTAFTWQVAPFRLKEGPEHWLKIKEDYGEHIRKVWCDYAPNMQGENILAHFNYSPYDISQTTISMFEGSIAHGHISPNQMGDLRPVPGWANYRMPVKHLYLCGGSAHPMGGVTGAPGFNCAGAIADDYKMKKWWWRPSKTLKG